MIDFLRVRVGGERFLGQIEEIKLLLEKSVGRKGGGHFLEGQSHIHREIIFRYLGLVMVIRMQ